MIFAVSDSRKEGNSSISRVAESLGDEGLIRDCFAAFTDLLELALPRNVAGIFRTVV